MRSYSEFSSWLFPGDPILEMNPQKVPEEVSIILEQVSCGTKVPADWLLRSAKLVLEGMAGLRCLWFLHGQRGQVHNENMPEPRWVWDIINQWAAEQWRTKGVQLRHQVDWGKGIIKETHENGKVREFRLGKWLRKHGADDLQVKEFETRQLPLWDWEISCHPFDVLTMSFERPWTSCARPGGKAERGPLTDMAAGSAVLFFYRPGAEKPCGRTLIRPALEMPGYTPVLVFVDSIYGDGPSSIFAGDPPIPEDISSRYDGLTYSALHGICEYGSASRALTRGIYDDTTRSYCKQDDDEYETAYRYLSETGWPTPVDVGLEDLRDAARYALENDLVEEVVIPTRRELASDIASAWVAMDGSSISSIESTINALNSGDLPTSVDYEYACSAILADCSEDYDAVLWLKNEMIEALDIILSERLEEVQTKVLILSDPDDEDDEYEINQLFRYFKGDYDSMHEVPPSVANNMDIENGWMYVAAPMDNYETEVDIDEIERLARKLGILENSAILRPGVFDWSAIWAI